MILLFWYHYSDGNWFLGVVMSVFFAVLSKLPFFPWKVGFFYLRDVSRGDFSVEGEQ